MELYELPDDNIRFIITELFHPIHIQVISKNPYAKSVNCIITITKWEDDVLNKYDLCLILADPFLEKNPIKTDIPVYDCTIDQYKELCASFGVLPHWLNNTPYIKDIKIERTNYEDKCRYY